MISKNYIVGNLYHIKPRGDVYVLKNYLTKKDTNHRIKGTLKVDVLYTGMFYNIDEDVSSRYKYIFYIMGGFAYIAENEIVEEIK